MRRVKLLDAETGEFALDRALKIFRRSVFCWRAFRQLDDVCGDVGSVAVDAGIDRTYVSRLERGLENPSVAVLEKLANALKASIPDLFTVPAKGEALPVRSKLVGDRGANTRRPVSAVAQWFDIVT